MGRFREWTTLQHGASRTGYSPVRIEPPYRIRWYWVNGDRFDPDREVSKSRSSATGSLDKLPEMIQTWLSRRAQPVSDGKLVFVGSLSDGHLYAIDLKSGRTRWRYKASGAIVEAATVADGRVYVGNVRGRLHCVRAKTGERQWVFEDPHYGSFMSCPAVVDGKVLIGSRSGRFFALDARTGQRKWGFDAGAPS